MKIGDLPLEFAKHFGNKKISIHFGVDPTKVPYLGTEFIREDGSPVRYENTIDPKNADNIELLKPMAGPFYRL